MITVLCDTTLGLTNHYAISQIALKISDLLNHSTLRISDSVFNHFEGSVNLYNNARFQLNRSDRFKGQNAGCLNRSFPFSFLSVKNFEY